MTLMLCHAQFLMFYKFIQSWSGGGPIHDIADHFMSFELIKWNKFIMKGLWPCRAIKSV